MSSHVIDADVAPSRNLRSVRPASSLSTPMAQPAVTTAADTTVDSTKTQPTFPPSQPVAQPATGSCAARWDGKPRGGCRHPFGRRGGQRRYRHAKNNPDPEGSVSRASGTADAECGDSGIATAGSTFSQNKQTLEEVEAGDSRAEGLKVGQNGNSGAKDQQATEVTSNDSTLMDENRKPAGKQSQDFHKGISPFRPCLVFPSFSTSPWFRSPSVRLL